METAEKRIKRSCPLNGGICIDGVRSDFGKDEVGNPVRCRWWTYLKGRHPQEDRMIDHWDCAMGWIPVAVLDGANQARQAGAATESFRNLFFNSLPSQTKQLIMDAERKHVEQIQQERQKLISDKKPN